MRCSPRSTRESNSIAIIVKHLAGNMRSRWTDFLTSDGEKPDRDRDSEFEAPPKTRDELLALWESGWQLAFDALAPLTDADLSRTAYIRSEAHSVMQTIHRQVAHYSYHIGQIVYLAKHFAGPDWNALTIPRRKSAEFNAKVAAGKARSAESSSTDFSLWGSIKDPGPHTCAKILRNPTG